MLYLDSSLSKPVRIQGAFISEDELKNVVDYLRGDDMPEYDDSIVEKQTDGGTLNIFGGPSDDQDSLYDEAKKSILQAGKASASFLQRKLKIGYARAARILDELEAAGIIGPADGAKPREILVTESEIDDTIESEMSENMHGVKESFDEIESEIEGDDKTEEGVGEEDEEDADTKSADEIREDVEVEPEDETPTDVGKENPKF